MSAPSGEQPGHRSGQGRVVRWDDAAGSGAVVVEGVLGEIELSETDITAPLARPLQPGELVDLRWTDADPDGGVAARATSATPTDG